MLGMLNDGSRGAWSPGPASRHDPQATGGGDHAMPAMVGARWTVASRAAAGCCRAEPGSIR
jgi:hypothetical protein